MVNVVSRIAAAVLGGYAFAWGFTTLLIAVALGLRLPYGDAQTTAYLLAFLVFLAVFLWSFAARRVAVVWSVHAGGGTAMKGRAGFLTQSVA